MSSLPAAKKSKISQRKTPRRRRRRTPHENVCRAQRNICDGGPMTGSNKVSDKLEALKNLIPATHNGETVKADQLFQETADYIVLLRTQVLVLQGLIDFYGSTSSSSAETDDNVVLEQY